MVKLVGLFLLVAFVLAFPGLLDAQALTKDQKAAQLVQREQALKSISSQAKSNVTKFVNIISVELSKTCLKFAKMNLSSNCLDYSDLVKFDTTNQRYSGKFVDEKGFFHREKPKIKNHEIVYRDSVTPVICVDCPGLSSYFRTIVIEPDGFVYKLDSDKTIYKNTRYEYHDRYVKDCTVARVSSNMTIVADTINYLVSGCTETAINEKVVIVKPYSKLSYDGLWYKHLKYLEEAKKLKGINCLKSDLC